MATKWTGMVRVLVVVLPVVLCALLVWRWWPYPREAVYSLYRDRGKERTIAGLQGYHKQSSEHFDIFYTDGDKNVVDMILETAEALYEQVVTELSYEPEERVPLIVYPNRDALRSAFGWGNGESAMGVYWTGTIRLLSPNVWIDEESPKVQRKVFRKLNPIAHELTHYLLDFRTNGNYPRWFTEGLAQRVEYEVSGYLWIESESTLRQSLYTLEDLEQRFDRLSNQPLAYRQSYLLVNYMARQYGEKNLAVLINRLAEGVPFRKAILQAFGVSMEDIHEQWTQWVEENLDQLEPET